MRIGLGVTIIVLVVNLFVFREMGRHTNALIEQELLDLSRALHREIVLIRAWVAHSGGVYIPKTQGVESNPFLKDALAVTSAGDTLVLRNPAMITRDLASMSQSRGLRFTFHVTSLNPLNPRNRADDFEAEALHRIERSRQEGRPLDEVSAVVEGPDAPSFRYLAPLITEKDCLRCHGAQGYSVGDIRGGLSISIPMDTVIAAQRHNKLMSILAYLAVSGLIAALVHLFVRATVVGPVRRLQADATRIGNGDYGTAVSITGKAEVEDLARALDGMRQRIHDGMERQIESEKLFALGQLAAGIAHDIRNPLFAVRNNLDFLQRRGDPAAPEQEVYSEMEDGLQRIDRIVSEVNDFAQPREPEFGTHPLRELIDSAMVLLRKQLQQDAVELTVEVEDDLPPVEMDRHRMEQVLINLVSNAAEATRQVELGHIHITAGRRDGGVELKVEDNGPGIRPEILSRIFDPFFTRSPQGTGLGLTIVKRIVLQHHGTVEVESRPGEGAVFTVWLPLHQPPAQENA